MSAALEVRDLSVHAGGTPLVQGVSFEIPPGGALTVLGESGSGKSLMAQALLARLPAGLRCRRQCEAPWQGTGRHLRRRDAQGARQPDQHHFSGCDDAP